MDVTMVYFSQTGSTRKVAEAMAEELRGLGHRARLLSLQKAVPADAVTGDLLALGCPCFSCQAPTPVKDFLRTLPDLAGRRTFVFATTGGAPGRVLHDLASGLRAKGAEVVGGHMARGEVRHPAPCLLGRFPGRPNIDDLRAARRFAAAVAEHVSAGRPGPLREGNPARLGAGLGFYDFAAWISSDALLRTLLPEPKADPTRCDRCRWCVHACPMGNIALGPHAVLGQRCIRCYRCLSGCPEQAFQVDWRLGNLVIWSLYNTTFERWFGDVRPGEPVY